MARRLTDVYIRVRPHDPEGWSVRYEVVDATLGGDEGEAVLIAGLAQNPGSVLLLQLHEDLLLSNGLPGEAEAVVAEIRAHHPDSNDVLIAEAALAAHRKDLPLAQDLCAQPARRISPEPHPFLRLISLVLLLPSLQPVEAQIASFGDDCEMDVFAAQRGPIIS